MRSMYHFQREAVNLCTDITNKTTIALLDPTLLKRILKTLRNKIDARLRSLFTAVTTLQAWCNVGLVALLSFTDYLTLL